MNILCILPRLGDSRIVRRIRMLQRTGHSVTALSFRRESDSHVSIRPPCRFAVLDVLEDGKYIARVTKLLRSLSTVSEYMRDIDCVYAFGQDLALLAAMANRGENRRPLIFETADVMPIQVGVGPLSMLSRLIDRYLLRRQVGLLVMTSAMFRRYYRDRLGLTSLNQLVIENKVSSNLGVQQSVGERGSTARLCLGWFGHLRDEWTVKFLQALSRRADEDRLRIRLAGTFTMQGSEGLLYQLIDDPISEYLGPFHDPEDLATLYNGVDLVLITYGVTEPESWARSNRYYQACFFNTPMVVRNETADAVEVRRGRLGLTLCKNDPVHAAEEFLALLEDSSLEEFRANLRRLPKCHYSETAEAEELHRAVEALVTNHVGPITKP